MALFVGLFCVILTMYGGGFATIPAYLADMFGTQMVGAIHGRLLTAWSAAGILGPVLVNYINDYQIKAGVPKSQAYDTTMYVLAGLLVGGFLCNLLVRPVAAKWFMTDEELAAERKLAHEKAQAAVGGDAGLQVRRHKQLRASAARSGCSSASRWPGASTSRCRRRSSCSTDAPCEA